MAIRKLKVLLFSFPTCIFLLFNPEIASAQQSTSIQQQFVKLEAASGGRIGISATNTATHQQIQYRANERFPMGCTSKVMGVAAILKKSMQDPDLLKQKMTFTKNDLMNWSPDTEKHVRDGMTIAELSAAAISDSDNTAMNLLVKKLGGLQEINRFARSINDQHFRQDHDWPEEALAGGPDTLHDSSTPAAMEKSLQRIALGNALSQDLRTQLLGWLKATTTGDARIRAGVPKNWTVADKTGTGFYYGTTNDIGIIWPPQCAPITVTIYYTHQQKNAAKREDIIAKATQLILKEFAQKDDCIKLQQA